MKKFLFYSTLYLTSFFLQNCNSCSNEERKYEVMKRYGGWEARADETRSEVESIRTSMPALLHYEFDSVDREVFDSEFPYWQEIHVYLGKDGIRHARLLPNPEKSHLTEEFYFDKGELMFATIDEKGFIRKENFEDHEDTVDLPASDHYFFEQNTLVLALDPKGQRKDITDNKVKIKGVDLLSESGQIQKIIADKKIKL